MNLNTFNLVVSVKQNLNFQNLNVGGENSLISFFNSRSEKLKEDGTYFAKGEMPSSNTHAIPWGNILLWTTPPLLAYTALKLSTWIYCVCYCCLLLSKHNNQTTTTVTTRTGQDTQQHQRLSFWTWLWLIWVACLKF